MVNPNVVQADGKLQQDIINGQGEVFVGKKTRVEDYRMKAADDEPSVDLHTMSELILTLDEASGLICV